MNEFVVHIQTAKFIWVVVMKVMHVYTHRNVRDKVDQLLTHNVARRIIVLEASGFLKFLS